MDQNEVADLLGKVAFDAYFKAVSAEFPPWDEIPDQVKDGWRTAAMMVVKCHEMARIQQIAEEGYAGMLPNGNIVDRRIHRTAIPVKKNAMLNIPEPRHLPK